jgi:hypothetical protein
VLTLPLHKNGSSIVASVFVAALTCLATPCLAIDHSVTISDRDVFQTCVAEGTVLHILCPMQFSRKSSGFRSNEERNTLVDSEGF